MTLDIYQRKLGQALDTEDLPDLVKCALSHAVKAHEGQKRASGEAFVDHPVEVACIVADLLGGDPQTVAAALLHDVLEDTDTPYKTLSTDCGEEVAAIVEAVTKLSKLDFPSREQAQVATYRKMILAMAKDIRVILVKLADRLHNMRTIGSLSEDRQLRIAEETLAIYAPIAHGLGIHRVKAELEDRAFAIIDRPSYMRVKTLLEASEANRVSRLSKCEQSLMSLLQEHGIDAEVKGRVKHIYSVHNKMQQKGKDFDEVTDIVALRVLVDRVRDAYASLGLVHAVWEPVAGRFKDYIALPKLNGYRSLHTSVITEGRPLEIQIRTYDMHRDAEYGIAAHFGYKHSPSPQGPTHRAAKIAHQRRKSFLADLREDASTGDQFFDQLLSHLRSDNEVYIYTPLGDVKVLPSGSTPLDFAYAVHTDVGNACVGARVNGRMVPFAYVLRSGDHVEVVTREGSTPSRDWLSLVVTPRAKAKIRSFYAQREQVQAESTGRQKLVEALRRAKLPLDAASGPDLAAVVQDMGYRRAADFYQAIGSGQVTPQAVLKHLKRKMPEAAKPPKRRKSKSTLIADVSGQELDVAWQIARCCRPIPGDQILGHVQTGRGLVIHRLRCPNLAGKSPDPESLISLIWADVDGASEVRIYVQGWDRPGILEDVSSMVAAQGGNIVRHTGESRHDAFAFTLYLQLSDKASLEKLLATLRSINGVFDAWRLES